MPSFSVRCLFRWLDPPNDNALNTYEERITLWQAPSIHESITMAEAEARTYAAECECEYLGYCQAYAMPTALSASSVEVFSLLRDSPLPPSQYIDTYFATGSERQGEA